MKPKGCPFILMDLETGDCRRFQNTHELRKACGVKSTVGASLKDCLEMAPIKEKYVFFAYESDLLRFI